MVKRPLGNTGFMIAPVVYGSIVSMGEPQDVSDEYVSWALDHGVNYFDVAPTYGDSEEKLGRSLGSRRKDVYIACKTSCRLRKDAEKEMYESLERLRTDYFDVYQLHSITTDKDVDEAFGTGGVMELMVEAKEKGLTRKVGITAHSEKAALRCLELYPFDTVLFPFNWGLNLGQGIGNALMAEAKKRNMGVISIKSMIHRRWLSVEEVERSRFPKSWCKPIDLERPDFRNAAIKYVFAIGVDAIVPPGDFVNFSYAVENIEKCLSEPLMEEDLALLQRELVAVGDNWFFDIDGKMKGVLRTT